MSVTTVDLGTIEGRHPLPVERYIWGAEVPDINDYEGMAERAARVIANIIVDSHHESLVHINLYFTGLTVATLATINGYNMVKDRVRDPNRISMSFMVYNPDHETYFPLDFKELNQ